jgi:hypothetical protein
MSNLMRSLWSQSLHNGIDILQLDAHGVSQLQKKFDAMWHGSVGCYCNLKSAGDFNCVGQG